MRRPEAEDEPSTCREGPGEPPLSCGRASTRARAAALPAARTHDISKLRGGENEAVFDLGGRWQAVRLSSGPPRSSVLRASGDAQTAAPQAPATRQ